MVRDSPPGILPCADAAGMFFAPCLPCCWPPSFSRRSGSGSVPQRFSPFAPISLDDPPTWFLDPRLAAMRYDPELCRAVLRAPHIVATPIADKMQPNGCGWTNAVRVREVGGAELGSSS